MSDVVIVVAITNPQVDTGLCVMFTLLFFLGQTIMRLIRYLKCNMVDTILWVVFTLLFIQEYE